MIFKLLKDEKGASYILILASTFLILLFFIVGIEVVRIHDIRDHVYDELYRASNLSIKEAMYDSYRIDSISRFDEATALNAFRKYLKDDLEINSSYEKIGDDGKVVYKLKINKVDIDGENVRMDVKATVYTKPAFNLWNTVWEVPLDIKSRNMRLIQF